MNIKKSSISLVSALLAAAGFMVSSLAHAQGATSRQPGWEVGFDAIYQDATTLEFDGGSSADLSSDWGLALTFGYRFNPRLELQFAFDWATVGYDANIVRQNGSVIRATGGDYESFTPRAELHFNFLDRPFTPYVTGGIGYSWVDTNIPSGRPQTGCWWDPWYGYICSSVQPTKSVDGFTYRVGAGVRWDVSDSISLRLGLDRNWLDFGDNTSGSPYLDQARIGFAYRY